MIRSSGYRVTDSLRPSLAGGVWRGYAGVAVAVPSPPSRVPASLETVLQEALGSQYRLERELEAGGMSRLFLATDLRLKREVVVKVLPPDLVSEASAARFKREIELTVRLQHPHILPILTSGEFEDGLFYITPYIQGESLRTRIEREHKLPLDDILRILKDVSGALAFAHQRGIVHRDIKPGNILLSDGQAILADFGIARAVSTTATPLTDSGVAPGTPAYMAPELPTDERADVYALGVVAYEMLTGELPERGADLSSILAHRGRLPLDRRSGLRHLAGVVASAISPAAASRPSTTREFLTRISAQPKPVRTTVLAMVVAMAAIFAFGASQDWFWPAIGGASLDSLRIAIVQAPFPESSVSFRATRSLLNAVAEWGDVSITTLETSSTTNAQDAFAPLLRRATRLRSRWMLVVRPTPLVPQAFVASLWDVAARREVRRLNRVLFADSLSQRTSFRAIAGSLFSDDTTGIGGDSTAHSTSLVAWRAYTRGKSELRRWKLDSARTSFRAALEGDAELSSAAISLGQLTVWDRKPLAPAQRAGLLRALAASKADLSWRDSLVARGVLSMDGNKYGAACRAYETLRQRDSLDVVGWIGLGDCRVRDRTVVRDAASRSGWRFRVSYQAGLVAYLRAAEIDPGSASVFAPPDRLGALFTSAGRVVLGATELPDTQRFGAYPAIDMRSDTVRLVPYPVDALASVDARSLEDDRAVDRLISSHRELLTQLARARARASPRDPDAFEALASALELRGDVIGRMASSTTATSAIAAARQLATDPRQKFRLAISAIRLYVKAGEFQLARALADSILVAAEADAQDPQKAPALAAVAALVGREPVVTRWLLAEDDSAGAEAGIDPAFPVPVRSEIAGLFAAASIRRCDSVTTYLTRVDSTLRRFIPPTRLSLARQASTLPALMLAAHCDSGKALESFTGNTDRYVQIHQSFARREFESVRAQLDTLQRHRRAARPGDVALDHTLEEVWLLAQIGDSSRALDRIRATLGALPTLGNALLSRVEQAGALCPILSFASDLAWSSTVESTRWRLDAEVLCHPVATRS
jgi:serine/threonine protein kinase